MGSGKVAYWAGVVALAAISALAGVFATSIIATHSGPVTQSVSVAQEGQSKDTARRIAAGDFEIEAVDGSGVFLRSEGTVYLCTISQQQLASCAQISKID